LIPEKFSSDLFITRTKEIIKQYSDKFSSDPNTFYDITLGINCLYGLLMMPLKKYKLSEEEATSYLSKNMIDCSQIKVNAKTLNDNVDACITFKEMITGLRNGLAHWEEKSNKCDGRNNIEYITSDSSKDVMKIVIRGLIKGYKVRVEVIFIVDRINSITKLIELVN
jgi:hypothetical protein